MYELIKNLFIAEPAAAYHAASKTYVGSHALADFRRCPRLHQWKQSGECPDEDRPAYQIGRAAHTLILEGRQAYEREYAVGGPINDKTGQPYGATTKAFAEWAAQQGKPVLTRDQADLVEHMCIAVQSHDLAHSLLRSGTAEAVVRTEWHDVPCQIRMDFFSLLPGAAIVDLKTSDDLTWFEADARRYGYAHQLAFYRSILSAAAKIDPREVPVHIIAVEKKAPYRCGVWRLGQDVLAQAQQDNEEAIKRLRRCQQTGVWPTGYEEPRTFDWL